MIAIPDMDKPKNCDECPIHIAELFGVYYDNDGKSHRIKITECDTNRYHGHTLGEDYEMMYKDCPLIDIVQCKDCKWAKKEEDEGEGNLTCACHIPRFIVPSDGFCYLGERRNE